MMAARTVVLARTKLVVLRRPSVDDALDEYLWYRDAELARAHGAEPLMEPFSTFMPRYAATIATEDPTRLHVAIDTAEGAHVGTLLLYGVSSIDRRGELGITIGPDWARGMGLGRQATIALLRYLWRQPQLDEVVLHTFEWNVRALRCFEACGFRAIDHVERSGNWLLRMSASRDAWLRDEEAGRFSTVEDEAV